jgi:hypothetical protein
LKLLEFFIGTAIEYLCYQGNILAGDTNKKGGDSMKRTFLASMVFLGVLAFAGSAWALTISGGTEVGGLDSLIDTEIIAVPNAANELAWVQGELGNVNINITYDVIAGDWEETNEADTFALELDGTPEYFFLKLGTGGLNPLQPTHFLYQNLAEFSYAVVALAELNVFGASNFDIGRVSHIGEIGTAPVPEPGTILLLGGGLLGLALYGRKRMKT